jgi:hypothetical protein
MEPYLRLVRPNASMVSGRRGLLNHPRTPIDHHEVLHAAALQRAAGRAVEGHRVGAEGVVPALHVGGVARLFDVVEEDEELVDVGGDLVQDVGMNGFKWTLQDWSRQAARAPPRWPRGSAHAAGPSAVIE